MSYNKDIFNKKMNKFFKPTPLIKSVGYNKKKPKELKITNISKYLSDLKEYTESNPITETTATVSSVHSSLENQIVKIKRDKNAPKPIHPWLPKPQYTNPQSTLIVFRLPKDITQTRLTEEFTRYGPIQRIQMIKNHDDKSKGYAFITFMDSQTCITCINEIHNNDGLLINGRLCNVDYVRGGIDNYFQPRWVMGRRHYRDFSGTNGYFRGTQREEHRGDQRGDQRDFKEHREKRHGAVERVINQTSVSYRSRETRTT